MQLTIYTADVLESLQKIKKGDVVEFTPYRKKTPVMVGVVKRITRFNDTKKLAVVIDFEGKKFLKSINTINYGLSKSESRRKDV